MSNSRVGRAPGVPWQTPPCAACSSVPKAGDAPARVGKRDNLAGANDEGFQVGLTVSTAIKYSLCG